jgi:steroid 5-alpha reductase family enzyme
VLPSARKAAFAVVIGVYTAAGLVALVVAQIRLHPLTVTLLGDLAATLVVFAASTVAGNASLYDPYWSVAPPVIVIAWAAGGHSNGARQAAVIVLVTAWAVRLTGNWARSWRGLRHEDWRYVDLRRQTAGRPPWWVVNLFGIQLMPTLIVYVGLLSAWPAVAAGTRPLNWLDVVATVVTAAAIAVEALADRQLHRFAADPANRGRVADVGLWRWSRHPNYAGEIGLWFGLWLFGLASAPSWWWTAVGPLAMLALFVFVSVPMMDRRSLERRPGYAEHMRRVAPLLPWPRPGT